MKQELMARLFKAAPYLDKPELAYVVDLVESIAQPRQDERPKLRLILGSGGAPDILPLRRSG